MEHEQRNILQRIDEMVTVKMSPGKQTYNPRVKKEKKSSSEVKEDTPEVHSSKTSDGATPGGETREVPWYEASGVNKNGVMEEMSCQQISPSLMQFINEDKAPQAEDVMHFYPVMVADAQASPYTPKNVIYVHVQQIRQEGRNYQYRRRSCRIASMEEHSMRER